MKRFLILGLLIVAFIVLYVNVNAEVDEIVIPEAANREISAQVVLKRILESL